MRCLHGQIQNSDFLKEHTAEKWLAENPQAAKDLQPLFPDKQLVQSQDSETKLSSDSGTMEQKDQDSKTW